MPSISVVTAWYNEEILAPLFLDHYQFADEINIILDKATTDRTEEIIRAWDKTKTVIFHVDYHDSLDWIVKSTLVNQVGITRKTDWVMAVDADEFVFPPLHLSMQPQEYLSFVTGNLLRINMYHVYRNEVEADIDPSKPAVPQRKYGNILPGVAHDVAEYNKSCIFKPETRVRLTCGCHSFYDAPTIREDLTYRFDAVHWNMADPSIATVRRLAQKERLGEKDKLAGRGFQNFEVTEQEILSECNAHLHDPMLPIFTS